MILQRTRGSAVTECNPLFFFFGPGKLEVKRCNLCHRPPFSSLVSPFLPQLPQRGTCHPWPVLIPRTQGSAALAPPKPSNGRRAARPSLSCSEAELLPRSSQHVGDRTPPPPAQGPQAVEKQCVSEFAGWKREPTPPSLPCHRVLRALPHTADLGIREDEPVNQTLVSGGSRQGRVCCWEGVSLLT